MKSVSVCLFGVLVLTRAAQYKTSLLTLDGALKVHANQIGIPVLGK